MAGDGRQTERRRMKADGRGRQTASGHTDGGGSGEAATDADITADARQAEERRILCCLGILWCVSNSSCGRERRSTADGRRTADVDRLGARQTVDGRGGSRL